MELAISLANTLTAAADALGSPVRLAEWLERQQDLLGPAPAEVTLRVPEFRDLRDAIRELFSAAAAGDALPRFAVERVNAAAAAVRYHSELDVTDLLHPALVEVPSAAGPAARMLSVIASSAIRLLGTDGRKCLRRCPAARCDRFFSATRPDQVWCSSSCGNRVRVARHAARSKALA